MSKTRLPEGDGHNVVVQFMQTVAAKPQNFRFKLERQNCGGCNSAEYACTCDQKRQEGWLTCGHDFLVVDHEEQVALKNGDSQIAFD